MVSRTYHIAQEKHVDNNNSVKYATVSFKIGDAVLILIPESSVGRINY